MSENVDKTRFWGAISKTEQLIKKLPADQRSELVETMMNQLPIDQRSEYLEEMRNRMDRLDDLDDLDDLVSAVTSGVVAGSGMVGSDAEAALLRKCSPEEVAGIEVLIKRIIADCNDYMVHTKTASTNWAYVPLEKGEASKSSDFAKARLFLRGAKQGVLRIFFSDAISSDSTEPNSVVGLNYSTSKREYNEARGRAFGVQFVIKMATDHVDQLLDAIFANPSEITKLIARELCAIKAGEIPDTEYGESLMDVDPEITDIYSTTYQPGTRQTKDEYKGDMRVKIAWLKTLR